MTDSLNSTSPTESVINAATAASRTPAAPTHAIERPHAPTKMLERQGSFRKFYIIDQPQTTFQVL